LSTEILLAYATNLTPDPPHPLPTSRDVKIHRVDTNFDNWPDVEALSRHLENANATVLAGFARTTFSSHGLALGPVGAARPLPPVQQPDDAAPRLPEGFKTVFDKDGWRD
jgi:hypothetical protein